MTADTPDGWDYGIMVQSCVDCNVYYNDVHNAGIALRDQSASNGWGAGYGPVSDNPTWLDNIVDGCTNGFTTDETTINGRVLDYDLFHACTAQIPKQGHGQTGDPLITNWASDWRLRSTASAAYLTGFFTSALLGYYPNEYIDVSVDRSGIRRTTPANIGAEQTVR